LKNFAAPTRMRVQLAFRNKMFFFFVIVFPFAIFFLYAAVFAKSVPQTVGFYLGPVLAFNVMGSFWGLSATLVTFREQGILRRFHVSPVTATDMLASSIVANFALTMPTIILELILARYFFAVHTFANLPGIFLLITLGTISFASLGLVIASVTNTMQETQVLNQLLWLPLIFLSGATLPLAYLNVGVQRAGLFLPATYLVNALQQLIFNSVNPVSRYTEILSLSAWACLTFFLSAQLFRWEPESKVPRRAKLLVAATAIPFLILGLLENRTFRILHESRAAFESLQNPDSAPRRRMTVRPSNNGDQPATNQR
jgi:ABC-type transport system involved in cytochrome c biogenesis permease component